MGASHTRTNYKPGSQRNLRTGISRRTAILRGLSRHISRIGRQHARGDLLRISRLRIDARGRGNSATSGSRSLQCKGRSSIQSRKTGRIAGRWKNRDHSRYNRTGCKTWIVLPRRAGHRRAVWTHAGLWHALAGPVLSARQTQAERYRNGGFN